MYYFILVIIVMVGWLASSNLKKKAERYSQIPLENGMTGKNVAEKMLYDNGIYDVRVVISDGILTDNYNPSDKTISLSKAIYKENNVFAAAVAAHETGHAIQHVTAYAPLSIRSALVPAVSFSSKYVQWIILAGLLLIGNGLKIGTSILLTGIGLFAVITLFSFITLPVEINASVRALAWLNRSGITTLRSHRAAEDALKAAAYTYVVSALSSLTTFFYYVMIYMNRRD
ncbi:MAG: zinc metallopeptidase [Candidatus Azobacteroides pseudotrichonymphae]|jgi:Zn-dependent membrane protease YugP|uniref:Zn-dependent protease n=1 Tax=Azobacteroides pseudotrichonymphae genomovar. CFP2 TaxID=511995 RepID=B6YR46_AZOPC|nr:zinc metallopeptidase [Candidatus Azobacteroides pseudotrichonymphae]MDR0529931.1 zinc metallopeptidase [Bacteroidales bacterium OttesenSCG-928-I14]BAG83668.1 putative Zn-dependent protease [Candidatus Azobacteroides pseudotrichonymphae genomovar. CFP2]GMO32083.1 MAG: zinc metallopeptidase [Candidatus Azobacteroides pseudotrichonymphae]